MQDIQKLLKQAEVLAIERRPEACLGCGFEHSCSLHGCAVIKNLIELAKAEKDNEPLTLEELREMVGEPVWVETLGIREYGRYGIVESVDAECNALFLSADFSCHDYGTVWIAYRHKPEGVQSETDFV